MELSSRASPPSAKPVPGLIVPASIGNQNLSIFKVAYSLLGFIPQNVVNIAYPVVEVHLENPGVKLHRCKIVLPWTALMTSQYDFR